MKATPATLVAVMACAGLGSGCGDLATVGRSPAQIVIHTLQAASGAQPDELGGTLRSDVITLRTAPAPCSATSPCPGIFNDIGSITMSLVLKDPGIPGTPSAPSALNQVTFTRYRVVYRRTDGRNTPGVDVPHPFDSGLTFTVPEQGQVTADFDIVRHAAKQEAPLAALATNPTIISTVADVSFFGRDQAGNDVSATASIGISFGNFGDPQ